MPTISLLLGVPTMMMFTTIIIIMMMMILMTSKIKMPMMI